MKRRFLAVLLAAVTLLALLPSRPMAVSAAAATMQPSQAFIDVLKKMEGFSPIPYDDYSQHSIGYGCYCPPDMVDYYTQNPITQEQGEAMLREQLQKYVGYVNNFAATHGLTLQQHQFDALVSFTYNCGNAWMSELTGFFNAAVRDGDMGNALIYGMMLYSTAGGEYILIKRRMCEANMYINGVYKAYNDGANPYPDSYRWVFLDAGVGKVRYKICGFDAALAEPINVSFSHIPTGKDGNGNPFAYTLAGWYTADGKKVEKLDSSLTRGQTLYAKWADPQGNIVTPPAQVEPEASYPRVGTIVNVDSYVNIRTGPGTSAEKNGKRYLGDQVTIIEEAEGTAVSVGGVTTNKWGKISKYEWVFLGYVQYHDNAVTNIQLLQKPTKTTYTQPIATVDPGGSVLLVTYANGYSQAMTVHRTMLSGFDGKKTGDQTITVSYGGKTASFTVNVRPGVPDSITSSVYRISEGTIMGVAPGTTAAQLLSGLNERDYVKLYSAAGEPLTGDMAVGTDSVAVLMDGDEYKAVCTVIIRGDVNGDGAITSVDATLILQHVAGWDVSLNETAADVNTADGITSVDATLILQHVAGWDVTIAQ